MAFSVIPPPKWVGRMPAVSVSQENGLNLSSMNKASSPPDARSRSARGHLQAEHFHGRSVPLVDQELIATYLYYLLTRIMILETASAYQIPQENIEAKAALLSFSRYLDRLWLACSLDQCAIIIARCLREISWRRYRPRPGRSYPRRSKSHTGKWALKWR